MNDEAGKRGKAILGTAAAAVAGVVCFCSCKQAGTEPFQLEAPPPSVPAARVERQDLERTVVIPAEFRPYVEVQLHGKVSGYLDQMNVDFGDRVKAGQLLATVEVPELQDQLNNAIELLRPGITNCGKHTLNCALMFQADRRARVGRFQADNT